MLEGKVLVVKLFAVDGLAAGAVAAGKVAALDHELLDDAVELGALVGQRLARLALALLARAEGAEVVGRLGDDVIVELERDAPGGLVADGDVEEAAAARRLGLLGVGHGVVWEDTGTVFVNSCLGRDVYALAGELTWIWRGWSGASVELWPWQFCGILVKRTIDSWKGENWERKLKKTATTSRAGRLELFVRRSEGESLPEHSKGGAVELHQVPLYTVPIVFFPSQTSTLSRHLQSLKSSSRSPASSSPTLDIKYICTCGIGRQVLFTSHI